MVPFFIGAIIARARLGVIRRILRPAVTCVLARPYTRPNRSKEAKYDVGEGLLLKVHLGEDLFFKGTLRLGDFHCDMVTFSTVCPPCT